MSRAVTGHMPFAGHRTVAEWDRPRFVPTHQLDLRNAPSSMEQLAASWKAKVA